MSTQPLVHPAGMHALTHIIADLPQSLLIAGPEGVGLSTLGEYIAHSTGATTIRVLPEKDEKIDIEKGILSVEVIRRLYDQTKSLRSDHMIVIIDYAERMAVAAQNAFLKLLEEPSQHTHFMLLSHAPDSLLPTVLSRVVRYDVRPLSTKQTNDFLDKLGVHDDKKRTQLLYMAHGLPAELHRLTHDDHYFEVRSHRMRDARTLLQGGLYDKLKIAHSYKDNRENALLLLNDAMYMIQRSISDNPSEQLIKHIDSVLTAHQKIAANGNIRLCLARLVL